MDFQQPHGYMRPPPPPPPPSMAADPYHHQAQRYPVPPPNPWYSNQFQFQQSTSPSPPPLTPHAPPQHQQWAPPPPHSDHLVPPPNPPYSTPSPYPASHPLPHIQYPPPLPHSHASLPPLPHFPPPQIPQSYPQVNQEWGTANWGHHQSWEYQANNNEEVWAAKARAWAAAKAASDIQQPQQLPYAFQDGNFAGDSTAVFAGGDSSISPSVHQQEVPSSYSSITGDSIRGIDPVATMPSDYNFVPPAEPAILYPSVPAVLLSGPQVDPSVAVPPPVTGHSAPIFGRIPGPSFQPTVSSVTAPFGIGAGPDMHPGTACSGDAFGAPIASERPKKASVPNWLREEIIKKKPVIVNSAAQLLEEDTQSIEDEGVDKSYGNGDQGDRKITESPRSTEDGDDDEDDVEEARNAAINQEIKRVLTEVLLKVTDELFDEIATKVLSEDDITDEVDQGVSYLDRKSPTFTPRIATSKASAKVVVPVKTRDINSNDASEKSNSSFHGDVLGLASYASDDDDNEIESSGKKSFVENSIQQQSTSSRLSKGTDVVENGGPQGETKEHFDNPESHLDSTSQNAPTVNHSVAVSELKDERAAKTSNVDSGMAEHEVLDVDASKFEKTLAVKVAGKSDKLVENHTSRKSVTDDSLGREIRDKSDKTDRREHERSYSGRNRSVKEFEIDKESAYEKERTYSRHDEKLVKKERRDEQNGSKERVKEKGVKSAEKAKDSDTMKKLSPDYDKESKKERHAGRRAGVKEENDRKRERTKDDKREKPRHRNSTESGRHKRHRSSSPASRVRDNKDGLMVGHASDLSDDSSENSKKKLHSKRRKSPSPVRSRKRQVSRSPHSKHSQRRHSPYSSLEASRGRRSRSRSRSPMRRKR